jgi:hypothetical protein
MLIMLINFDTLNNVRTFVHFNVHKKISKTNTKCIFIFGFCILLGVLSRLLEGPSLATTFKGVYFYLYKVCKAIPLQALEAYRVVRC